MDPSTAAALTVAVSVVALIASTWLGLHSLNRQHRNSLALQEDQHRRTASLQEAHLRHQLQLDIFREISAQVRTTAASLSASVSTVRSIVLQLDLEARGWNRVRITTDDLLDSREAASRALIDLILVLERYEIVFYRLRSARVALDETHRRMLEASSAFHSGLGLLAPHRDGPNPHPFRATNEAVEDLKPLADAFTDACGELQSYCLDLQIEAQNVLLGELFGRHVPPRRPGDPSVKVLELDPDEPWLERPPGGRFI
jgi:hypothetical protein